MDVHCEASFYHFLVILSSVLPQVIKVRDSVTISQFTNLISNLLRLLTTKVSVNNEQTTFLQQATNEINNALSDASISRQLMLK